MRDEPKLNGLLAQNKHIFLVLFNRDVVPIKQLDCQSKQIIEPKRILKSG